MGEIIGRRRLLELIAVLIFGLILWVIFEVLIGRAIRREWGWKGVIAFGILGVSGLIMTGV
ncbi:MAG: hypothetical protein ACE5JO_11765 [Candidatus Binatia bacterium]